MELFCQELMREAYQESLRHDISIDDAIQAKYERLKPICESYLQEAIDLDDRIAKLQAEKLKLMWESYQQKVKMYTTLDSILCNIQEREKWDESRLIYLKRRLQNAALTSELIEKSCLADTYGDKQTSETLDFMAQLLDRKLSVTNKDVDEKNRYLQALQHMPMDVVREYKTLRDELSEKMEHVKRLQCE